MDAGQCFNNEVVTDFSAEILFLHLLAEIDTDIPGKHAETTEKHQWSKNQIPPDVPDKDKKNESEREVDDGQQGLAAVKAPQPADGGEFLQVRPRTLGFQFLQVCLEDMLQGQAGGLVFKDSAGPGSQIGAADTQAHLEKDCCDHAENEQAEGAQAVIGKNPVIGLQHHDRHGQCQQIDDER